MDESKRQLWEGRFEEQGNSVMTVDTWCAEKQISKHTFYYWKQRIRGDTGVTRGRFCCHLFCYKKSLKNS